MDQERHGLEAFLRLSRWLLLLVVVLPYEFDGRDALWPWQGLGDANFFDALLIFLPLLGVGSISLLLWRRPQKVVLSLSILGLLAFAALFGLWARLMPHPLGLYERLTDGLPPLFSRALWFLVLGQAMLAAGLRLGARGLVEPVDGPRELSDPWPVARVMTGLGVSSVVAFYLLPYRASVPLLDLLADIGLLLRHLHEMSALGLLAGHVLSLGPLAFAAAALWRLFVPARGRGGALVGFLIAYLPCLCLVVGLRNLPTLPDYTLVHLRSAALLLAVTGGLALALSALPRALCYEIPWLSGRLTRFDDVLAAGLSLPDPEAGLRQRLASLSPLLRPWLRHRLRLWRSAASSSPEAGAADLSRVMLLLERRWREERLGTGQVVAAESEGGAEPGWPAWARGQRLGLGLFGVLGLMAVLTWSLAQRPDPGQGWPLRSAPAGVEDLLTERLPEVVMDMFHHPGLRFERLPSYGPLEAELGRAEALLPGIRAAVLDLLELGGLGRRRVHRLRRARDALNHLLREHGVPFFVSSRVSVTGDGPDMFYVLVYRIVACRRYALAGQARSFAVLELSRADRLNLVESYLGVTEEEESSVAIFSDRLEPILGGRLRELMARDGVLAAEARRGWDAAFPGKRPTPAVASAAGLELLREGLTRHELHHRWMGLEPEPSTLLWTKLDGFSEEAVRGVTAEVGAYLGELRFSPAYARLRLALMLDSADRPMGFAGLHGRARAFLLEQILLPELAADFAPRIHGAAAAERLSQLKDEELMRRIDELHRRLFGQPAPVFTLLSAVP